MKSLLRILRLIGACVAVASCAGAAIANEHIRWTEEVKLSDGRVIEIQRHGELTSSGFPAQRRGFDKYHEICYPPMGIHWKSKGGYQPDIFDIVDGKAYMHVPVTAQKTCYEQGSPTMGAIYFVWENGRWKRIKHEEFPAASQWNLLMQVSRGSPSTDPRGRITIEDKTTGEWKDWTLRGEQKRLGWKRINESYYERDGCKHWSRTEKFLKFGPEDIFINDGKNTCHR